MANEWAGLAPYVAALIMAIVGYLVARSRNATAGAEHDHWRRMLQAERERADRLEQRVNALVAHIFALNRLISTSCAGVTAPMPPLADDAPAAPLTTNERGAWRRLLAQRLSHDELCNAAYDLGLDVEGVQRKGEIVRRLLDHLDDRGKMDLLRRWLIANDRQDVVDDMEKGR